MNRNRRQALKAALLLTSPWLTAGRAIRADESTSSAKTGQTVVVIGAGMAGLAAAQRLQAGGYNVIVVEGRHRAGGRMWTDYSLGTAVDLGAAWIHGDAARNPLMKMVKQYDLLTKATDWDETWLYDDSYGELEDETYDTIIRKSEQIIERLYEEQSTAPIGRSMADALAPILKGLSGDPIVQRGVRWWLASLIEVEYAANFDQLSLKYWNVDEAYDGHDVIIKGGYQKIVERLVQGLDIRYGHVVRQIDISQSGSLVTTDQGVIECGQAVVTLPLGVLKQGKIKFNPKLPDEKVASIERIGMGVMNKVVLEFKDRFWPEDASCLGLLKKSTDDLTEFMPMTPYTGKAVIVGFTRGRHAKSIETMSNEDVIQAALSDLRSMFGSRVPQNIAGSVVTRWHSDEFSRGSYSCISPGSSFSDYKMLARPIDNRIFFAGEATHAKYLGTVHGAYLSGERAANEIMQSMGSGNNTTETSDSNR